MRIEPTTRILRRQSSMRRHSGSALNPAQSTAKRPSNNTGLAQSNDAAITEIAGKDIIALNQPEPGQSQLSAQRWRAFVPFIAQYIGQETATETPARSVRRHGESARETYQKQTSFISRPRTVSHI